MLRSILAVSPLLLAAASAFTPALTQERMKKKEAKDFPALMTTATNAWTAGEYTKASKALEGALKLVSAKRRAAVLATFPAAPDQWTFKPAEANEAEAQMMIGITGLNVEGHYTGPANERVTVTAMIDSPMVQMMSMMFSNPAMLGDDAEVIKYGQHKALLQKNGPTNFELTILVGDDLLKADCSNLSDDDLLKMMSQAVVDKFEKAVKG